MDALDAVMGQINPAELERLLAEERELQEIDAAIKLARKYSRDNFGPERYEIITAAESFHGRTMRTSPMPMPPTSLRVSSTKHRPSHPAAFMSVSR